MLFWFRVRPLGKLLKITTLKATVKPSGVGHRLVNFTFCLDYFVISLIEDKVDFPGCIARFHRTLYVSLAVLGLNESGSSS